MLATARTFCLTGIEADAVRVEVDVHRGLPSFSIVGLPDAAVRESRERVRAALVNSGFDFPLRRITANLAPADLRKKGPGFDLAIAAALLAASGQLPGEAIGRHALAGELALDGSIRPVPGALAMAEAARSAGMEAIAVAERDAGEAALVGGVRAFPLRNLAELPRLADGELRPAPPVSVPASNGSLPDLADLRGQPVLRHALEVAAAGGHSLLILGPPGAGKSLAAHRLPSLLPPLSGGEALEVRRIAGIIGASGEAFASRPFRAPHHTISAAGLVGGGNPLRPGEVTLAHRGVLFLDELGEFSRDALEALRQPLEAGRVTVSRAGRSLQLPCSFLLVAASNPCPCGRGGDSGECRCPVGSVDRYRAKLSGALADRIDLSVGVEQPSAEELGGNPGVGSAVVRERVSIARQRQARRLGEGRCNAAMSSAEVQRHCRPDLAGAKLLADGHRELGLSGRGWDRVLKVARTLADLAGGERVGADQVGQALTLRRRADGDG